MKSRFFLGLTMMTLMIAGGCSKDEVNSVVNGSDANSIGFEISTGKTRAEIVNLDVLQKSSEGFGIFAVNGTSSSTFIDNKAYRFEGGAWKWAELDMLWPTKESGYPVNFYAYFPKTNTTLTNKLTVDYIIAETPETQIDYLVANQTGVADKPVSGDVLLAFRHILSKVDFKVVTGSKVTVEIQSVSVRNVGNTGKFSYLSLGWTTPPQVWNSGFSYMTAPVKAANKFAGQTVAKDVAGSSGSLMLMPQNLSGRGWDKTIPGLNYSSYIEVVYRVYETESGKDIVGFSDATDHPNYEGSTVTGPLFIKVGYSLPTDWLMGKAYAYTIHIADGNSSGGNLIEGNFIDENGEGTNLIVVYPETGEPIEPPDVIFPDNAVIGFVVSVENWGPQEENPLE